jgi:hypothetical protein
MARIRTPGAGLFRTALATAITLFTAIAIAGPAISASSAPWDADDAGTHDHWRRDPELGMSLADLVAGMDFTVVNDLGKTLTFSEFDVDVLGKGLTNLDWYRVLKDDDGFTLVSPIFGLLGWDSGLALSYTVTAGEGSAISAASVSFLGGAIWGAVDVDLSLKDGDEQVAELHAYSRGIFRDNQFHDFTELPNPLSVLGVDELIGVETGLIAGAPIVRHRFESLMVMPEPSVAVLIAIGLVALSRASRPPV